MSFVNQPVLIRDLRTVGIGQDVVRDKNGSLTEIVEVVPYREAVILAEGMVDLAKDLVEVLLVRADKRDRPRGRLDRSGWSSVEGLST